MTKIDHLAQSGIHTNEEAFYNIVDSFFDDSVVFYFALLNGDYTFQTFSAYEPTNTIVDNGILSVLGYDPENGQISKVHFPLINLRNWAEIGEGTRKRPLPEWVRLRDAQRERTALDTEDSVV